MLPCVCSVIDHRRRQNVVRTSVTYSAIASCATFLFLPHFDVICDLLLNRRTATWNLFVKSYVRQGQKQSNLRAFKGKRQCFSIFYDVNMRTKAKLTVNFLAFPLVKLRKICHTGYLEYFALVGACFYERYLSKNFFL